jgi:hypothetical protein
MPFFASFEDIGEWATLVLCWPIAAGLTLAALALAFSGNRRAASKWCAIACMVASVPLVGAEISLLLKRTEPRHSIPEWLLKVSIVLAPLFVAVAVFWYDLCFLRKDRKVDQGNSKNRSDGTSP